MRNIQFDGQEYPIEKYHQIVEFLVRTGQTHIEELLRHLDYVASQAPQVITDVITLEPLRLPRLTLEVKIDAKEQRPTVYFRAVEKEKEKNITPENGWVSLGAFSSFKENPNHAHNYEPNSVRETLQAMENYCNYLRRIIEEIHSKRVELVESQHNALEYIISEYTLLKMTDEK